MEFTERRLLNLAFIETTIDNQNICAQIKVLKALGH